MSHETSARVDDGSTHHETLSPADVAVRGAVESEKFGPLRRALSTAIIGIVSYYGARMLGASPIGALIACAAVSSIRVAWVALRDKRIDVVAGFILVLNASTIAVGLITESPLITLLSEHLPGVVFAVWVFGGLALRRPITETIVAWIRPGWVEQHIDRGRWDRGRALAYHRTHMRLTAGVAVLHTAHLAAIVIVILTMPVDDAKGVGTAPGSVDS